MKKIVIKFGLIGGAIVSLFMICTMPFFNSDSIMNHGEIIGYSSMIIASSTIFIGIRSYRNKELDGVISFGKAFVVGLYIALIASTLYVITWMILSGIFMPDFMENYTKATLEGMQAAGNSQGEIDAQMADLKTWSELYKNPFFKVLLTYLEILPVGLLVSLISAAILKNK